MKRRAFLAIMVISSIWITSFPIMSKADPYNHEDFELITLRLNLEKKEHILGDPVRVSAQLVNNTKRTIKVHNNLSIEHGDLQILIAREDGSYKEYHGPWPTQDMVYRIIDMPPGSYITEKFRLLYTGGYTEGMTPKHLNAPYAREHSNEVRERLLQRGYAFPEAGHYTIKAVLGDGYGTLESAPIHLEIDKPVGVDKAVWGMIKDDYEYAYFLQTGSPPESYTSVRSSQLIENFESIVKRYPTSRYAESIQSSLMRYHSSVEKLRSKGLLEKDD